MPVWANLRIAYSGHMEQGWVIPGLDEPIGKLPNFPEGTFAREEQPPLLASWPMNWNPRRQEPAGGYNPGGAPGDTAGQGDPTHGADPGRGLWQPRDGPGIEWDGVAGMLWNRSDPRDSKRGPLWAAAPGAYGNMWALIEPAPGFPPSR